MLKNAFSVAIGVALGWPLAQIILQLVVIPIVTKFL